LIFESEIALFFWLEINAEWTKTSIIRLVKKKDMLKKIKALILYGKSYLIVTQALTIICFVLITNKGYELISPLFWFKIITSSILIYRTISYKKTTIYMFLNVGISEQFLIYSLLIFDFIIFMSLIIII
jgi:hypothetical protein